MKGNMREHYVDWLAQYRWQWTGVLTLRRGIRLRRAFELVRKWIATIAHDERHPISVAAVLELGELNEHPHFHVLIAGIGTRLLRYLKLWETLAGVAKLKRYTVHYRGRFTPVVDRKHRGVAYALKSLTSDDYRIELDLHDEHLLPQFRRRTRGIQRAANGGSPNREAPVNDR